MSKEILKSDLVGKKLAEVFLGEVKNLIKGMKEFASIEESETFLSLIALYAFCFFRATDSSRDQIADEITNQIYLSLSSALLVEYSNLYGGDDFYLSDRLTNTVSALIDAWDKNIDKPPAPHWFVAKYICKMLRNENNIALITTISEFLSTDSIVIKKILEDIKRNFEII
jgi:hypothetical protein